MTRELPPGVWTPGVDQGRRQFLAVTGPAEGGFVLECGGRLPSVTVAYESWGTLADDGANGILLLHALTGDSHAAGPVGPGHPTRGWWDGLIGPGLPLNTDRYCIVCPNVLGGCQGTTGPASPDPGGAAYGSRFPLITIRDQVAVEAALADALGVEQWACVVGGSMGGMRVLEWAVGYPQRLRRAVVLAVGAAATAEQIALCSLQIRAIRQDPAYAGGDYYASGTGPAEGLSLARGIGQLTYRTAGEFQARFGRRAQAEEDLSKGGRFAIESYLQHHGDKLVERFDANSYVVLSEAMNHHDVGRGRGGMVQALGTVRADVTVAGIASDRLYPLALQEELGQMLPGDRPVVVIESEFGHDGFLLEVEQIGSVLATALGD
jgi:homoserine O-acetyltransferase/O-succinyltransferase